MIAKILVLALIASTATVLAMPADLPVPIHQDNTLFCFICEELVNITESAVNASIPDLQNLLDQYCQQVPQFLQSTCVQLVQSVIAEVTSDSGIDPAILCSELAGKDCNSSTNALYQVIQARQKVHFSPVLQRVKRT